tara:strand:- start:273 stop:746 length:474 start_codon:yes stop_codon:yes gene_type:complete
MKIVTKNYAISKGDRSYLIYLVDHKGNSLECFDIVGEKERLNKENELSEKYNINTDNISYVSLEDFKSQDSSGENPLFLIFYLNSEMFSSKGIVQAYGDNVKKYLDNKGDNIRLFFMPTKGEERIECINPVFIEDQTEFKKLEKLVEELEKQFQLVE